MAKDQRPVPLPNRPATPTAAPSAPTDAGKTAGGTGTSRPLPPGGAGWSKGYYDKEGIHHTAKTLVPIDKAGVIVPLKLYGCPTGGCEYTRWVNPTSKVKEVCGDHEVELRLVDHAKQTEPPKPPRVPVGALWKASSPKARAFWVLAAEAATGAALTAGHIPATYPLVATPLLAAAAYITARWHLTAKAIKSGKVEKGAKTGRAVKTIRRRARTATYMAGAAGGWLTAAAAVNPGSVPGETVWGLLLPLFAVTAPTWWRYQDELQSQLPAPAKAADPEPAPADEIDPRARADAAVWKEDVAGTAQGLRHTTVDVTTWRTDPGGRRMVIRASKGAITDETIRAGLTAIAGAFDIVPASIGWVTNYAADGEEGSPRAALLLLQPNSPLKKPVPGKPVGLLPFDDLSVHMGMKIDSTDLRTILFQPGWGARSRWIVGTTGAGKTGLVRRLLLAMILATIEGADGTPTRLVAPLLHDPKRGADYGLFRRAVCGFSVESDTLHMIVDALVREMNRRYDLLGTTVWTDPEGRVFEGEKPFDPRTMGPVISLTLDEFHINAKDQALMEKLEPFGRKMRAAGIQINGASQASTLGDSGSQVFRDMLAGGEAWLLRTTNVLSAALVTGGQLAGDPRALPREPGMLLYSAGEDSTMQCRAAFDEAAAMYDLLYGPNRAPRFLPVQWPDETLEAFGSEFVDWMRASQTSPLGSPVPEVPKTLKVGAAAGGATTEVITASAVLRRMLYQAGGPMKREHIIEHPLWTFNVTSTPTAVFKAGVEADPAWLAKVDNRGTYDLTPAVRQQMAAAEEEARDPVAA